MPILSVLVLTYNRVDVSSKFLPSIVENAGSVDHNFIVWDNGSTDGTFDWLQEWSRRYDNVLIFGSEKNVGMEAINYMAEMSGSKYIIKVDDDVVVPNKYGDRLIGAYEKMGRKDILYLAWDMYWGKTTFAKRSGMNLYRGESGSIVNLGAKDRVLVSNHPSRWMVNGACRLSDTGLFLEAGGHPKGMVYGVDTHVSRAAEEKGYKVAFFSTDVCVLHNQEDQKKYVKYRKFKDLELRKNKSPKRV